jgi:Na+-translocating ferredoxin:NAD+ oxidoreductase RnfD subunit
MRRSVKQFFKTQKGLLIFILAVLIAIAAPSRYGAAVAAGLGGAALIAGLADVFIIRARKGVREFPSGAVLTAMIVTMALRAQEPWYVLTVTSLIVLSKYIVRSRTANVFNPAALG